MVLSSQIPYGPRMCQPRQIPYGLQSGYAWAQAGMVEASPHIPKIQSTGYTLQYTNVMSSGGVKSPEILLQTEQLFL